MAHHPRIKRRTFDYSKSRGNQTFFEEWTEYLPEETTTVTPIYRYCYQFTINGKKKRVKRFWNVSLRNHRLFNDPLRNLMDA